MAHNHTYRRHRRVNRWSLYLRSRGRWRPRSRRSNQERNVYALCSLSNKSDSEAQAMPAWVTLAPVDSALVIVVLVGSMLSGCGDVESTEEGDEGSSTTGTGGNGPGCPPAQPTDGSDC